MTRSLSEKPQKRTERYSKVAEMRYPRCTGPTGRKAKKVRAHTKTL
ncbi:hypothetical protein HMPREF9440_01355 [Sutterella parvirubra YIT 11816]|uniref:Uncharacterized protein n=1 Tax=Sutterella parvirubra YIT 11816 TaxID=762967 RepID=H3KF38_9BURK|nr:hypothetical protein HMPREF9440_01355 [Sutterella parvirubra YIT 11816]